MTRNCCAANQFSGCCEGGDCTSYAARPVQTVAAKHRSFRFLEKATVAFYLAVIAVSLFTLDNHFKRQALIEQENVHVVQR
jgi:hypothetical protein